MRALFDEKILMKTREVLGAIVSCRNKLTLVLLALAILSAIMPETVPIGVLLGGHLLWRRWLLVSRKASTGKTQDGQPPPTLVASEQQGGLLYLGRDKVSDQELWLTNYGVRSHLLVLGEREAERRETLFGMAANALTWGSGFLYIDSSGDASTYTNIADLCDKFGRSQDLMVLNFRHGPCSSSECGYSHRFNPFSNGSPSSLTGLICSLSDVARHDGDLWHGREIAMLSVSMDALCHLRDNHSLELDVSVIRDHLTFKSMLSLADDDRLPLKLREAIVGFLRGLPGYRDDRGLSQSRVTLDSMGYLEMQYWKMFGVMAECYGHIFCRKDGTDVDLYDVLVNRRALLVMLPSMDASFESAVLARTILALLKAQMEEMLGIGLEGSWKDVVEKQAFDGDTPFLVIADSVGAYPVDGMSRLAAKARALNIAFALADNSYEALSRATPGEADNIFANSSTRILMRENWSNLRDLARWNLDGPSINLNKATDTLQMSAPNWLGDRFCSSSREALITHQGKHHHASLFYDGDPRPPAVPLQSPRILHSLLVPLPADDLDADDDKGELV